MLVRTLLRPVLNTSLKINFRLSSHVSNTPEKLSPDEPVKMKNPFKREKVQCVLCKHNIEPDYKNVKLLSQFQSPYTGRIYGRHITKLCKRMQGKVEHEIIKAQSCALMGTYHKNVTYLKDPKLFDPERPVRPHKY